MRQGCQCDLRTATVLDLLTADCGLVEGEVNLVINEIVSMTMNECWESVHENELEHEEYEHAGMHM